MTIPLLPDSPLPPLYARWIDTLLQDMIPAETEATCDDCAMCAGNAAGTTATVSFDPRVKCCSYLPTLPNFLVGRILDDAEGTLGRRTVESRLGAGLAVTPLGISQPPTYKLLYDNSAGFGRNYRLRCPHYDEPTGSCGIWEHRNGVCATWFCKHTRGAIGLAFWRRLRQLLTAIEQSLARWCVLQLAPGPDSLAHLFPIHPEGRYPPTLSGEDLDDQISPEVYAIMWGRWVGQEPEFYRRCASLVNDLQWNDVLRIGGPDIELFAQLVQTTYHNLQRTDLPAQIQLGQFDIIQMDLEYARVVTYSPYDPLDVPRPLFEVLHYFDRRPTQAALQAIADAANLELDPELISRLLDFEILRPA